jgi:hypothetical protein
MELIKDEFTLRSKSENITENEKFHHKCINEVAQGDLVMMKVSQRHNNCISSYS